MRFGLKQSCVAACAILSLMSAWDTAHALGTTIVATGVASCKIVVDILNTSIKHTTRDTCDGTTTGVVATNLSPTVSVGNTVSWLSAKPNPKRKDNLSCFNISYEEDWLLGAGPARANGECVATDNATGNTLHMSFEYERFGLTAVITIPAKKAIYNGSSYGDNSIYTVVGGTKTSCPAGSNPAGAGVFAFIPKGVPSKSTEIWLTGVFAIDC